MSHKSLTSICHSIDLSHSRSSVFVSLSLYHVKNGLIPLATQTSPLLAYAHVTHSIFLVATRHNPWSSSAKVAIEVSRIPVIHTMVSDQRTSDARGPFWKL